MRFVRAASTEPSRQFSRGSHHPTACMEPLEIRRLLSTYWLSPSGSDQAAGTADAPWQTLQHALASVSSGDVINLNSGTYAGGVKIQTPNLTIQAAPGQQAAISAPSTDSGPDSVIDFALGADGGKLLDLDISGGAFYAIKTESNYDTGVANPSGVSNLLIQNCRIHDSGRDVVKITPGGDHISLVGDEIYNSGQRDPTNAEGIDNVNGSYMLVSDCYFHDIATNGLYAKGGAIGTVVQNSKFVNIGLGGILLGQSTDYQWFNTAVNPGLYENLNGVVQNNTVINTQDAGIALWATDNALVDGNTLVNVARSAQAGILITGTDHYLPSKAVVHQACANPTITNNTISGGNIGQAVIDIRQRGLTGSLALGNNRYACAGGTPSFIYEAQSYSGDLTGWQSLVSDAGSSAVSPLNPEDYMGWSPPAGGGTPYVPHGLSVCPLVGHFMGAPAAVLSGQTGTLKLRLTNTGGKRFAGPVAVTLSAGTAASYSPSDPTIVTLGFPKVSLKPGASRLLKLKFNYPAGLAAGGYHLIASINAVETNTASADAATPAAILIAPPTVDLGVGFAGGALVGVRPGRSTTANLIIENLGNVAASGSLSIDLFASTDPASNPMDQHLATLSNRRIRLLPGRSLKLRIRFVAPPGAGAGTYSLVAAATAMTQPADGNASNDVAVTGTRTS
ncbi:MAG: hypothetical protein JWO87_819 [Phycisphaerales bacterium]|nr:hypothetical protein [Phycisphaerales bacterium]